jgi:hypothetical protein
LIEVFLSYSRETDAHREWVGQLADRLDSEADMHVHLDEYDLYGGKDLPEFMERCANCDRVVVIVTSRFTERADQREGGVGYETAIAAAELATTQSTDKFIPLWREGSLLPVFLRGKRYVDLRLDDDFECGVDELLRAIRRQADRPRPTKRVGASADGQMKLSVHELNALVRAGTIDGVSGEVKACQNCGSSDLESFHDADVDQEWADGSSHAYLNYFIDGVECRECGWKRTEFSDRNGKVFERQITEGES